MLLLTKVMTRVFTEKSLSSHLFLLPSFPTVLLTSEIFAINRKMNWEFALNPGIFASVVLAGK